MPTVTNHDILGLLSLGENARQSAFASKGEDNGFGVSALFGGSNCQGINSELIAEEHDYAAPQRFVSSNSYYGYHPVVTAEAAADCSMDTSENNLQVGTHPITCGAAFTGTDAANAGQGAWSTNVTRKRNFEPDQDMFEHAIKRTRQECSQEATTSGAEAQGFGIQTPSLESQSYMQVQTFDLPNHQLPGSTSQMVDANTTYPRCRMGHYI